MEPFRYVRAADEQRAVEAGADAVYIAGGTTLVDLMRLDVMRPKVVVDLTGLPLAAVEADGDGVRIGALARNTDVAYHPLIAERYPVLAEALLSGASAQVRNMATVGGNLLQRTRCPYFRDVQTACNKREPGAGCAALEGYTRSHAVLGVSDACIATHPSDMAVALVALDAIVHVRSAKGDRKIAIAELHTEPGAHPEVEHTLQPGELITHVTLPASSFGKRMRYVKVRDRASFAFALASAAAGVIVEGGKVADARLALGGVATKPWRASNAEAALKGQPATIESYRAAAKLALDGAKPRRDNEFKIELAQRTIVRALMLAGGAS